MNNSSVFVDGICEEAKKIMHNTQMGTILVLESVFGILAAFPNLLTIVLLYRVKVFHMNLRVLLAHLSFDLLLFSVALAEKALRRLLTPVCNLPILFQTCVMVEWVNAIPLHNAMLALVILLLERLYATIRFRTYDSGQNKYPYLAVFLLVCSWFSTLAIQLSAYAKAPVGLWVPVCEMGLATTSKSIETVVGAFVSLESLAAGLMIFIFVYNRFMLRRMVINRAQFDLSSRFQVDQNVTLNAALLPSAVLHVICYLPNYIFLLFTLINWIRVDAVETKAWLIHLSFLWRIIYACLHPILLITLNPNLKFELRKMAVGRVLCCSWIRGRKIYKAEDTRTASACVTDAHFNYLEKSWGSIHHGQIRIELSETCCSRFGLRLWK